MSVLEVLAVTVPVLLTVAFVTIAERKTMASMQRRLGPNAVGWYGLLQAFADALKLLLKEYVSPTQANIVLFFLGPIITLIFSLLGYAVVPYGPGLVLLDYNLGILYMLAVSSLATYGILLAGWSANSKYAFLGSKWPVKGASLYLKQTISEKFRKLYLLLTLIGTLYNSLTCHIFIFYYRFFSLTFNLVSTSTIKAETEIPLYFNNSNKLNLYITEFYAGYFRISIYKNHKTNSKLALCVQPVFSLQLDLKDLQWVKSIKSYFYVAVLNVNTGNKVKYTVNSAKGIINVIIPHFYKYLLESKKYINYVLFKSAVLLVKERKHHTDNGLQKLVNIGAFLNKGLTEKSLEILKNIKTSIDRGRREEIIISTISNNIRKRDFHSCVATPLTSPSVTPFKWGSKVKILLKMNNPQVTKAFNALVGTSEAIRLLSILFLFQKKGCRFYRTKVNHPTPQTRNKKEWNQWLAGLIDGNGSFYLSKKGYASLDITMDIRDEHLLQIIKNVYGGSIKLVSGAKALRYSLRHKEGLLALVNDINGEIRNSYRLMQLNKICLKYDIALTYSDKLTYNNGWLSGFFDADGSVTLNSNNGQLAITLTQKTSEVLQPLLDIYGGSIYIDRTSNNFNWYVSDKKGIINLIRYFKQYPSRSLKKNRLHLIPRCYELKEMGAHKSLEETNPLLAKSWVIFKAKWAKYVN